MAWPTRPMTSTGSAPRPVPPISNTAPMTFRPKKKKPGEVNPEPNNAGRLTGPPIQKGPGAGSMFADGRKGIPWGQMPPQTPNYPTAGPGRSSVSGQPQYGMPPTPNYPTAGPGPRGVRGQAQGAHPAGVPTATAHLADGRKRMMDDGGMMGNPMPIGDDDADDQGAPPPDASAAPPDQGAGPQGDMGPAPAIKPESVHYHDDLQQCSGCQFMGPDGQCSVLQMQVSPTGGCSAYEAGGGGDQGPVDTGAGFAQNDQGTSGAPSLS